MFLTYTLPAGLGFGPHREHLGCTGLPFRYDTHSHPQPTVAFYCNGSLNCLERGPLDLATPRVPQEFGAPAASPDAGRVRQYGGRR